MERIGSEDVVRLTTTSYGHAVYVVTEFRAAGFDARVIVARG